MILSKRLQIALHTILKNYENIKDKNEQEVYGEYFKNKYSYEEFDEILYKLKEYNYIDFEEYLHGVSFIIINYDYIEAIKKSKLKKIVFNIFKTTINIITAIIVAYITTKLNIK